MHRMHTRLSQGSLSTNDRLAGVFSLGRAEVAQVLHPDFLRYFRDFFAGKDFTSYFSEMADVMSETEWVGSVLDLGCGFGVSSICLRILGAVSVIGCDFSPVKVDTATKLAKLVDIDGVSFSRGTAEDLSFPDQTFDGVLIKDTVSHLRHDTRCYAEVFRVLKPGGTLLIVDDRNILNHFVRWRTRRVWRISEFGSVKQLAEFGMDRSFTEMRKTYIQKQFPELDAKTSDRLARLSRGYLNSQLSGFVQNHRSGEDLPVPFAKCVNPENAVLQERLIDPFELVGQLSEVGFRADIVLPSKWRNRSSLSLGRLAALGWPRSLALCSSFHTRAVRPAA